MQVNFSFHSYDHVSNRQVNITLIHNIQGVLKENKYDPTMIKSKYLCL